MRDRIDGESGSWVGAIGVAIENIPGGLVWMRTTSSSRVEECHAHAEPSFGGIRGTYWHPEIDWG